MTRLYLFADEAGDFDFRRGNNISRYFILCTVTMEDCHGVGAALLQLRRRLAWEQAPLGEYFHATTDKQAIRDEVFAELVQHQFHVQATIMDKPKAQPHVRSDRPTFYRYGWYYHLKHSITQHLRAHNELLAMAASLGTSREKNLFSNNVRNVLHQLVWRHTWRTYFCPASHDPCLQIADYCAWAIQRKWERGDTRSHELIADRITYEYDLWRRGTIEFY